MNTTICKTQATARTRFRFVLHHLKNNAYNTLIDKMTSAGLKSPVEFKQAHTYEEALLINQEFMADQFKNCWAIGYDLNVAIFDGIESEYFDLSCSVCPHISCGSTYNETVCQHHEHITNNHFQCFDCIADTPMVFPTALDRSLHTLLHHNYV